MIVRRVRWVSLINVGAALPAAKSEASRFPWLFLFSIPTAPIFSHSDCWQWQCFPFISYSHPSLTVVGWGFFNRMCKKLPTSESLVFFPETKGYGDWWESPLKCPWIRAQTGWHWPARRSLGGGRRRGPWWKGRTVCEKETPRRSGLFWKLSEYVPGKWKRYFGRSFVCFWVEFGFTPVEWQMWSGQHAETCYLPNFNKFRK